MSRKAFWFFRSVFAVSAMLILNLGYIQAQQITGFIPRFVDELGNEDISVIFQAPNGNVGIGTTNPGVKLQVVAPGNAVTGISNGPIGVADVGVFGSSSISAGVFGNTSNPFAVGVLARSFKSSPTNPGLHVDGRFTATGTKAAVVPLENGQQVSLYAEESTEVWFSDYGSVQLLDGYAHVEIDPLFLQTVNTDKKYHIFVTPEGNPNGTLYIDNKTPTSFDIREISNSANIEVSYRIVAKRKNFADERMMIQDLSGIKGERLQQLIATTERR